MFTIFTTLVSLKHLVAQLSQPEWQKHLTSVIDAKSLIGASLHLVLQSTTTTTSTMKTLTPSSQKRFWNSLCWANLISLLDEKVQFNSSYLPKEWAELTVSQLLPASFPNLVVKSRMPGPGKFLTLLPRFSGHNFFVFRSYLAAVSMFSVRGIPLWLRSTDGCIILEKLNNFLTKLKEESLAKTWLDLLRSSK